VLLRIFKKHLIDDRYQEAAYEGVSAQTKGWIKKSLALCRNYYRPDLPVSLSSVAIKIEETLLSTCQEPCHSVVVIYPADYAACTRAVAATLPAFFAGAENVIAVAVEAEGFLNKHPKNSTAFKNLASGSYLDYPLNFNLLAAWELAGVEKVALLPHKQLGEVLNELTRMTRTDSIRIMVLGAPVWLDQVFALSGNRNFKIWHEVKPEQIQIQSGLKHELQILKNLHPDIKIKSVEKPSPAVRFLVGDDDYRLEADHPVLALGAEYAGCWLWPELKLDFFYSQTVDVGQ